MQSAVRCRHSCVHGPPQIAGPSFARAFRRWPWHGRFQQIGHLGVGGPAIWIGTGELVCEMLTRSLHLSACQDHQGSSLILDCLLSDSEFAMKQLLQQSLLGHPLDVATPIQLTMTNFCLNTDCRTSL